MKPKLKKTLKLACVAIALTTFSACAEKMVFTDNPDVNPDDKGFTEVPLLPNLSTVLFIIKYRYL